MLEKDSLELLRRAVEKLDAGFSSLPTANMETPASGRIAEVLIATAERLQDNYPYFHPLYAGQMLKPPHPVAHLAYALAQCINPNNHALDGGRASSAMEKEAVQALAKMFGWDQHLGHLTNGGTMANLEALWVAGQLMPGQIILASEQAHYTHSRISGVLKLPFESIPCDDRAQMDLDALKKRLNKGGVGTVVVTMGTTATGSVDPLGEILALRQIHGFRVHCDAAYGGYFGLAGNLASGARTAFDRLPDADSIVIDPHKHGLQPYGCGCVLFRDPSVGQLYRHDSPYTYFSSKELHLGEISLECSRPGAAAVALWATQALLPLERGGEFAKGLQRCREAALHFHRRISNDNRFVAGFAPELDIVIFAPRAESVSQSSVLSRKIFDAAASRNLHLAVAELPLKFFAGGGGVMKEDRTSLTCLRSVLMKPEHRDWIDRIWNILSDATDAVLKA
ncbi:MAG: aminotransferase class I/II-fold pyridoxal phosphate-dependent enzyme [Candidatus Acidiferrum sp.]